MKAAKFVRVRVGVTPPRPVRHSRFAVVLSNGRRIETETGFDEHELVRLIRTMESVAGRYSPAHAVASDYLQSSYTYDSEGRMTGQTYPAAHNLLDTTEVAGASFTYEFDEMGRPKKMNQGATPVITNVEYNVAGQPTAVTSGIWWANSESRSYNALGQMTALTNGSMRFECMRPANPC